MRDRTTNPAAPTSRRRDVAARPAVLPLALALTALVGPLGSAGCGDEQATTSVPVPAATPPTPIPDQGPRIEEAPERKPGTGAGADPGAAAERPQDTAGVEPEETDPAPNAEEVDAAERRQVAAAEDAYGDYVRALNARDGSELCRLLDPSFMDELELPVARGPCAERLGASLGFADPRGTPVWRKTVLSGVESALLRRGARVQLSVAIVTEFEGRDQASVESDIAYLEPAASGYLLAKAPGSLWRAVGKPDVPPTVITPPPGF